jgi:23S rRNA (cytosine1962-C5)-methyltransferase
MECVVLKPGKDKAVRNRHHWIFSGAVRVLPEFEDGSLLEVRSASGDLLGHAYFNRRSSIVGRMVSFGKTPPEDAIRESVDAALRLRKELFDSEVTNSSSTAMQTHSCSKLRRGEWRS